MRKQGAVPCTARSAVDINLCAGAGGLALGLVQAGFALSHFYEMDSSACATLRYNTQSGSSILSGTTFQGDISKIEWLDNGPPVRLLSAGVPCQPFSRGGYHRGHEDSRNLFPTILKSVRLLRPQAILFENVRGLEREPHRPYLEYVLNQIRYPDVEPGQDEPWQDHAIRLQQHDADPCVHPTYEVRWSVFNAADFGVSQVRHRLFIVATQAGLPEYRFPVPTHSKRRLLFEQSTGIYWESRGLVPPKNASTLDMLREEESYQAWTTVRDAIVNLPAPACRETKDCNNHWSIPGARVYAGHTGSQLDWPSKTLKAGVHGVPGGENAIVQENGLVRYYTLREMARIQSFPDNHYFFGARSNVIRQIGNAVPCSLAREIAAPLKKLLEAAPVGMR